MPSYYDKYCSSLLVLRRLTHCLINKLFSFILLFAVVNIFLLSSYYHHHNHHHHHHHQTITRIDDLDVLVFGSSGETSSAIDKNNDNPNDDDDANDNGINHNNNNNSYYFDPGSLTEKNIITNKRNNKRTVPNKVDIFRHCSIDPQKYKSHIYQNGNAKQTFVISKSPYYLLYAMVPKSGSTTSRTTLKENPFNATKVRMNNTDRTTTLSPLLWHTFTFTRDPVERFISSFQESMARYFYNKIPKLSQLRRTYIQKRKQEQEEINSNNINKTNATHYLASCDNNTRCQRSFSSYKNSQISGDHEFMVAAIELFVNEYDGGFMNMNSSHDINNDIENGGDFRDSATGGIGRGVPEEHLRLQIPSMVSKNTPLELLQLQLTTTRKIRTAETTNNNNINNDVDIDYYYVPPNTFDAIYDVKDMNNIFKHFVETRGRGESKGGSKTYSDNSNNNNNTRNINNKSINDNNETNNSIVSDNDNDNDNNSVFVVKPLYQKKLRLLPQDLSIKTIQKICQLVAIDYCCLNYRLPKVCNGVVTCQMKEIQIIQNTTNTTTTTSTIIDGENNGNDNSDSKWIIETVVL